MKIVVCFRHLRCIGRKWWRGSDYSWHVQHLLREFGLGPYAAPAKAAGVDRSRLPHGTLLCGMDVFDFLGPSQPQPSPSPALEGKGAKGRAECACNLAVMLASEPLRHWGHEEVTAVSCL